MRKVLLLISCLFTVSAYSENWRFPRVSDISGSWKMFRETLPRPFHAVSDFDGNGVLDEAWIAFSVDRNSWSVVVFMNEKKAEHILFTTNTAEPTNFGIDDVEPGVYPTACGKGYWKCAPSEFEVLELEFPALRFFAFESASRIFYWDGDESEFLEVWESD